ncbi:MAG: UvrD-helicase domain-containing protein [Bacillota bacterium]
MAEMICAIEQINNQGEEAFYRALDAYLDNTHVVYWNREIYGREFDFCVLILEIGIAVIEVKGWQEDTIVDVPRGEYVIIRTEQGEECSNPRIQARAYRFAVFNHIKNKLGKQPVVFHMVCYPFISFDSYIDKHLDLISEPQLTFTKDDLASKDNFLNKLDQAIAFFRNWGSHAFTPILMNQVRSLFEPNVCFEKEVADTKSISKPKCHHLIPCYSIVCYIPASENSWQTIIDELAEAYSSGCRIYCMVGTQEMLKYTAEKVTKILKDKGLKVNHKGDLELGVISLLPVDSSRLSIFNWQTVIIDSVATLKDIPHFKVIDGELDALPEAEAWLFKLDACGAFNFSQYLVEHAKTHKNILVRAGAGTGKTYAMILRVAYLCYAEDISPANLADRILMITFTNDAADNMKNRLKSCFQNYFLLTGQVDFLEMIAQVDCMQISTIHSYAQCIIKKLGTAVGYGQDLKITSGLYNRRLLLEETLENYVREQTRINPQFLNGLGLPVYELREKLMTFIDRLENKSIDISEVKPEQFGTTKNNQQLHQLLIAVLSQTEREFDKLLLKENRIYLGSIMSVLARLVAKYPERLQEELSFGTRYMFIDEFQDTDDIQIAVLKEICRHVGYLMFVVGDIKQCIYRFRGAEEKAFDHLKIDEDPNLWEEFSLFQELQNR